VADPDVYWNRQGALAFGAMALILFGFLLYGLRKGEIELPLRVVTFSFRRKEAPVRFWAVASLYVLLGTICASTAVSHITQ
jgi:hypothetical protein